MSQVGGVRKEEREKLLFLLAKMGYGDQIIKQEADRVFFLRR